MKISCEVLSQNCEVAICHEKIYSADTSFWSKFTKCRKLYCYAVMMGLIGAGNNPHVWSNKLLRMTFAVAIEEARK